MALRSIFLSVLFLLSACASTGAKNQLLSLEDGGTLSEGMGVLLVSTGRGPSGSLIQLPFVSYGVYKAKTDTEMEKVAFLPAEAGFINQLGKRKYGFIHLRELEAGEYYLIGQRGRGNALDNPLGLLAVIPAGAVHYDSKGKKVGISMKFTIEPGLVNYLGEVLIVSKEISPEAFEMSDQSERDYAAIKKKHPMLNDLVFAKQSLVMLEKN